jgi:hypothetical protein
LSLNFHNTEDDERISMAQDKFLPNGTPSYERMQVVDDQKKFTSVFASLSPFGSRALRIESVALL